MSNHNQLTRRGTRLARTALVVGLGVGAAGGAAGMRVADNSAQANANKEALISAEPFCEVPPSTDGLDVSIEKLGKDPATATVRVIKPDGRTVNPYSEASMDYGNKIPSTDLIAVDHVGEAVCIAAGGMPTKELTADFNPPVQVDSASK